MKSVSPLVAIALAIACLAPAGNSHAATAPAVVGAVAHRTHGTAGSFDLALTSDRAKPTVEARQGTKHSIVFTFDKVVSGGSAVVTVGTATVGAPTFSGTRMTVPLTSVKDVQYVRIAVKNVVAADGGTGGAGAFTVGFLQGDVDQSRAVTTTDVSLVAAAAGKPLTVANFLLDVNADGTINRTDLRLLSTGGARVLPAPPANRAPVANAGAAQSVTAGAAVSLDGSASADPDGDALSYSWTLTSKPSGSAATLGGSAGPKPSFTADLAGAYVVTLVVNDGLQSSAPASVTITAAGATDPRRDAARFLRQATFGATRAAIDALVTQGYAAWLEEQFAKPATSHLATVRADPNLPANPWAVTMPSVWKQFFEGEDQLRQRVGFALSQIFVVSLNNDRVLSAPCGPAAYLDLLNRGAFGNARDLLKDITLNPAMGEYLSMKESAKADPVLQTQPDENYAREVMQLFSVGTVMLNLDGSTKLDGLGKPIPTYTEDTVKGFAKALSGWTYAGQDQSNPWRWLYPDIWDPDDNIRTQKACPAWSSPMQPWTGNYRSVDDKRTIVGPAHDTGSKQLLVYAGARYSTLPANQSPQADLENVIDNVFNHPNVGPFLSRQLIMRLVTSNPSPQYVARVATRFNDNGSGVRGDMKAVVRAILLDSEARSLSAAGAPSFGKLTEPVVRFVQLHRAFAAKRANGYYDIWDLGAPAFLNQSPLHAPSVFNFYHPDYAPAGPVSRSGLVGPEFEITNASSVAGFADFSRWGIINGFDHYNSDAGRRILPDYGYYLALTATPTQLVDELDLVLCAAGMNAALKAQIAQAVGKVFWSGNPSGQALERLNMALWLVINSPDYSVQK
jgi:uncharacterized protein (DUF1800 family)